MRNYLQLQATIQGWSDVEAAAGSERKLRRFEMLAYSGAAMTVRGWEHPVVLDLAGLAISERPRPIFKDHSGAQIVGHTDSVRIDGAALHVTGVISGAGPAAREVVISSENGFPWQASVGAAVERTEFVAKDRKALVNGQELAGPVLIARKSRLAEVSFVALGADENTTARVAAERKENQDMEFEAWIEAQGFKLDELSENQKENLRKLYAQKVQPAGKKEEEGKPAIAPAPAQAAQALAIPAPGGGDDPGVVAQVRSKYAAELQRIEAIRNLCGEEHPQLAAQAIAEGWDATRTELEVLRASRPTVSTPSVSVPQSEVNTQVLEAACAMAAGLVDAEKQFEEKTLDAARKRFRGSLGLQELLLEAAWANGYTGRNFRACREVLRYAFTPDLMGGWSNIDISGILSNTANKFLLDGFFSVERTWRNITAIRNVSDFKAVTSYRLIGADQYKIVPPGGELKHGALGEEKYTNKADTYGLLLSIDRRDVINDDLGAITTVPRKLGRGSGLKINDVFWKTFLANAAFFSAANKNYIDGADSALGITGLTKGTVAFDELADADGNPIGVMPAILLVSSANSALAAQLRNSAEMRENAPASRYPTSNPFQGRFRTEVSRYLANAQFPGASAKAWYLLADPRDLPVIEVAFLNGQESPTIETAEADFSVLGIQFRGFHDFGCSLQDPKGGIKSKGEA